MFFIDLLLALVIALVIGAVFVLGFRRERPGPGLLIFLLVLFLLTWAGGVWITPFGPTLWGSFWLPFLLVAIIVALVLSAFPPPGGERSTVKLVSEQEQAATETEAAALNVFFWVLIAILGSVILLGYLVD